MEVFLESFLENLKIVKVYMINIFVFVLWNFKEVMILKLGEKKIREIEVNGDIVDIWDFV